VAAGFKLSTVRQNAFMDDFPKDLLDEIHDLGLAIVNAGGVGDDAVAESVYLRLRELYDIRMSNAQGHPFLTEIVAGFTLDNVERIQLFKESIRQCAAFPNEPVHTKELSLAETLLEIARFEEAEAYLVAAREHALSSGDAEALKEIAVLLRNVQKH
jgi:hypothetical protein